MDEASTAAACDFYEKVCNEIVPASGSREAGLAELVENTYRHVDIALVNEMARFCHKLEIDLWDAIRLASTKPFGFQTFYPVRGWAGTAFRSTRTTPHTASGAPPVRSSGWWNSPKRSMQGCRRISSGAHRICKERGKAVKGSRVQVLGVTCKANIAHHRQSPAVPVAKGLLALGAELSCWDPFVEQWALARTPISRTTDTGWDDEALDLQILLQAHSALGPAPGPALAPVLDTRGLMLGVVRL